MSHGRSPETPEQILARVDRSGGLDACWPWTGSRFARGYGRHGAKLAHRLVYGLLKATPVPALLRHSCDNKPCCNPAHLLGGSNRDNMQDKASRGRWKGMHGARITADMTIAGRRRVAAGERIIDLAREFDVPQTSLGQAVRGVSFAWLTEPPPLKTCRSPGSQTGERNNNFGGKSGKCAR